MKNKYFYLIIIFLIVASFAAFGRILDNGFVNFDDHRYITENSQIKSGIHPESIRWAFTSVVAANWHPLTLLSHMLDWKLFGANASGHHFINLLLHIGSVLFLFLFLNRTTKSLWLAAFAAALFALHPLRVESVAWAAERKDVLSMFFGLACIYAYACYTESSRLSRYFLCLLLFALSLMAKPTFVTLPFLLLLLDYWPLNRHKAISPDGATPLKKEPSTPVQSRIHFIGGLLLEKAPFVFLTTVSCVVTLWAQNKSGAVVAIGQLPFSARLANAVTSYVAYLGKFFSPVDLAVFYPYAHYPLWQIIVSCLILLGITIVAVCTLRKLPFLLVGWFWYLGTLIPVIGLVQVGAQAMADRYTYLPSIGISLLLVWSMPLLFQREDMRRKILFPASIIYLTILAALTWQQCGYWRSSSELWIHALQATKNNYRAHANLAYVLAGEGKNIEAIDHFTRAILLQPYDADLYDNRGTAYLKIGQYQLAIEDFNQVIRRHPDWSMVYVNRGFAYAKLGQYHFAVRDFDKVVGLKPDNAETYRNLGAVYAKLGRYQAAIQHFNDAVRLKPDYAGAYGDRGYAHLLQGNIEQGCLDAQKACDLGNCLALKAAKGKGYCP